MTPEQLGEFTRTLGIAAPLVVLLIYLLRQANEERQKITERFLGALESTVARAIETQQQSTSALKDITSEVAADRRAQTDEHNRIVDAIGKLGRREP